MIFSHFPLPESPGTSNSEPNLPSSFLKNWKVNFRLHLSNWVFFNGIAGRKLVIRQLAAKDGMRNGSRAHIMSKNECIDDLMYVVGGGGEEGGGRRI